MRLRLLSIKIGFDPLDLYVYSYVSSGPLDLYVVHLEKFRRVDLEFVNLSFNRRDWQIICNELESLNVKLLPQTCFLKNRPLYNDVDLWHANVFPDIIVGIQVFLDLHQSLNLLI